MNKPVSTAQQNAINTALSTAKSYTDTKVADLIDSTPTIQTSTTDLTAGTSELASGTLYCVYE